MSGKKTTIALWTDSEHESRGLEEAISELEREAQVRKRCYDRWMGEGRISYIDACDRQERLLSAIAQLRKVLDLQEVSAEMTSIPETDHLPKVVSSTV